MNRKLIIDGNAVYEVDEDCMLKKQLDKEKKDSGAHRNVYMEEYKKALRRTE